MKTIERNKVLSAVFAFSFALTSTAALAASHGGMDHSKMGEAAAPAMDHSKMSGMDHSKMEAPKAAEAKPAKNIIRESTVEKTKLSYELLDIEGKASAHGGHGMAKPNHLMVFPVSPDGKPITGAKVGFMVTKAGSADQKVMAMEMEGGYGADVDMKAKGKYEIKTKVVKEKAVINDSFTYEVK